MRCMRPIIYSVAAVTCVQSFTSIAHSRRAAMSSSSSTTLRIASAPMLPEMGTMIPSSASVPVADAVSPYLIHKGRAVDMIKRCVSVEGLSVSKGWTPQATEA